MSEIVKETDIATQTLEKIVVAYMPSGSKLTLSKKYLANLIKKYIGLVDAEIDDIPVAINATIPYIETTLKTSKTLNSENLYDTILNELKRYYPEETKFDLKSQSGALLSHDDYIMSIQISNKLSPFVKVTLRKSGKLVGFISLQYEAQLLRKVAVAKRKINREEIIGVSDVEFVEQNIYALNKVPLLEEDLPVMADKIFQKGEIIDSRYVKDVPLIVKGQTVKAISIVSGITVSTLAQALENGYVGSVISVKNTDNGSIIKGTVREDGTIMVLEVK
ncbi:MAG: flagellar basal body P-ring formation chaperone FlgA [Fervidobacterium sp.]